MASKIIKTILLFFGLSTIALGAVTLAPTECYSVGTIYTPQGEQIGLRSTTTKRILCTTVDKYIVDMYTKGETPVVDITTVQQEDYITAVNKIIKDYDITAREIIKTKNFYTMVRKRIKNVEPTKEPELDSKTLSEYLR